MKRGCQSARATCASPAVHSAGSALSRQCTQPAPNAQPPAHEASAEQQARAAPAMAIAMPSAAHEKATQATISTACVLQK